MTVLEGIQKSADFLAKKGVDSPRLQAELLLAHVLKVPRMQLYLSFERVLTASETDTLRELVRRRGQREPLQHILGSTSFCGLEIAVTRDVLVPRPETELLAEAGWQFLSTLNPQPLGATEPGGGGSTVLDFGGGSGCLAVSLAVKRPEVQIFVIEISGAAIEVARRNAAQHHVADRLQFIRGENLAALPAGMLFDLIVSNPPYIPTAEIASLEPEVRDYDPRGALDGGPDGLQFYRELAVGAPALLKPEGRLMVEFGDGEGESVATIFESQKWIVERVIADYTQRPRILVARR